VRTAIVGAGPTGLYLAIALARRGHHVTVVDRDPGPSADGAWPRKGVMQFHHPHGFRGQVVDALLAEMPEVLDDLVAAGAVPATIPERPGRILGLQCRRATFERVLRAAALTEPGVQLRRGHADDIRGERGHVVALTVDGHEIDAELVIDASGRAAEPRTTCGRSRWRLRSRLHLAAAPAPARR
jgi:2-polyprenyl-6-methoxyphenol hydroxylase-like FAD-dependent oxidoreductase